MNEAEISRIVGGRSKWQDLEAKLNQIKLDPAKANSITPEQRQQISALVNAVKGRVDAKLKLIDEANAALIDAGDVDTHRRIIADTKKAINDVNAAAPAKSGGGSGITYDDYLKRKKGG